MERNIVIIYADLFDRFVAYLIDFLLIAFPLGILFDLDAIPDPTTLYYPILIVFLVTFLYFFLCTAFNRGQSFGQMIMKVRIVNIIAGDGSNSFQFRSLTWLQCILHSLGKSFPWILLDFIIGIIYKRDPQYPERILQYIAGTRVIKLAKSQKTR
jgi:uncharacterized RDD family membrane protein YckC